MTLDEAFDSYLPQVDEELRQLVSSHAPAHARYYGMMRYHLGWMDEELRPIDGACGKRLRPMLCLLCCAAARGEVARALPAACAVELVHNFSLVHDDIQDNSTVRRGRRAVWDVWGAAQGINVGDGLFVLARLALNRLSQRGVPLGRCQAAAQALDQACLALCEGQFLDMHLQGTPGVTVEQYLEMIGLKTAALFSASAQLGAIVATEAPRVIESMRRFGHALGLAFQIQDDILGTWGDEEMTGKSAATDLRDKKQTLPIVYALTLGKSPATARTVSELYARPGPLDAPGIQAVLAFLADLDARTYAQESANHHLALALAELEELRAAGCETRTLGELAASLLNRRA